MNQHSVSHSTPTIVKLKFDNVSIHGRDDNIDALRSAVQRVERLEGPEVVFVNGPSGCGKTAIVQVIQKETEGGGRKESNEDSSRYFVSGNFDRITNPPSSAFADALSDLCEQVAESQDVGQVRSSLNTALGDEDAILRDALPRVDRIIGRESERCEPLYHENFAFDRLKISFRALLRSIMRTGKTIVIFIDDLHWGDLESWELMKSLASDSELQRLLLVGAYRDDAISPLASQHISDISETCRFQNIYLGDFNEDQLNELVASVLKTGQERTRSLTSIIYTKSAGNPHFTLQFMKAAEERQLISYSMEHFCWEWDTEKIKSDTDIGDNIVDIYVAKIDSLPNDTKNALIFGSCLGAKFDALVVESVLMKIDLPHHAMGREQLTIALEQGLDEGLVGRQSGSSVYRFAHDKIYSAFYSLVDEIMEPDQLHMRVGRVLLQHWETTQPRQDWLTFLAANQLNQGIHLVGHSADRIEMAQLNLEAAKAAMSASAYRPASEYLQYGLRLIDDEGWGQYDLRLELSILLSRTEFCIGNFQKCQKTIDEVIRNARTAEEKIPVFRVCVDALGAEGKVEECIKKGMIFVKELGVKLPKKYTKLTVIFALLKAKKMMKGKSEAELVNYAQAVDPTKLAAVRILNTLTTFAVHARLRDLMVTLLMINTQLILKYGFTEEASSILAAYGILLAWTGNFEEGYKYGQIGIKLAEKTKQGVPRAFMNYYTGLDHLRNPLHQSLEPLLRGHQVAFEVGDTMYGFYCSFQYLSIFYFVGLPLKNLLHDMELFGKEMKAYNTYPPLLLLKPYHQAVINLTSGTSNPTVLQGTAMTEEELICCGMAQAVETMWFSKLLLALYFNDYDVMRVNLNKLLYERPRDVDGCMFHANVLLWAEGFAAMLIARRTKQRKYRVIAHKRIKKIEKWARNGNVNCHHFLLHLYAERAAWEKKPTQEVKRAYDDAISASRRAGFMNTAALVNERAALFFLDNNDTEWASLYMVSACELYEDWGATTKKQILLQDYKRLIRLSEQSIAFTSGTMGLCSTFMKGRKRYTSVLGKMHRGASLELVDANSSNCELSMYESFGETLSSVGNQYGIVFTGNTGDSRSSIALSSITAPVRQEGQRDQESFGSTGDLTLEDTLSTIARESVRIEEVEIL